MSDPDKAAEYLHRQQQAAAFLGAFEDEVLQLESDILSQLLQKQFMGNLSDADMRSGIGGIAALRTLLKRIDRELQSATKLVGEGFNQPSDSIEGQKEGI